MTTESKRRGRGPGVPVPNLKSERVLHGYTVRGLAAAAGVDASTVNAVENGHRGVQASTLRKLAEALGVETRDLVGGSLGMEDGSGSGRGKVVVARGGRMNAVAAEMLYNWSRENPRYDKDVLPELQANLDADRSSDRKLFS